MQLTKQNAKKASGTFRLQTSHPFHLSLFRQRGNRQIIISAVVLFTLVLAFQLFSEISTIELAGFSLWLIGIFLFFCALLGVAWSAFWMRTRRVEIQKNGILLHLAYGQIHIPWSNVRDLEPIALSKLYPIDEISVTQRQRLGRLYNRTGLQLRLKIDDLGWKRWLIPWPMMGEDPRTIILLVQNWSKLAKSIPDISNGRFINREQDQTIRSISKPAENKQSASASTNKQPADLLFISAGNRQTGQLINQLRQKYELFVAKSGPEAIKLSRSLRPTLVVIDEYLPNKLNALDLIKTLKKQHRRHKCGYLCLSQQAVDPETELELFDSDVMEILDLSRGVHLALKKIDYWFDSQQKVKKMAQRNQELYGQNLYQRSELARHGELKHFLPKDVAQEVITGVYNRRHYQLRRQTVTVLFADIVGFTPLSAKLEPEVLAELLNEYLQQMTQVVVSHGGVVDKFIGDEVMALFGAPEEEAETVQVQNAFSAALSMVATTQALDKKWQNRLPAKLEIRVGVNTGECTAGVFGSESLRSYTVIGSPVNLAARLTSSASPDTVVCSANSLQWVEMRTKFSSIGNVSLKGIQKPIEAFKVHSLLTPDFVN